MADVIYDAAEAPRRCPVGTEIQTLLFDREFFTPSKAQAWVDKYTTFSPHSPDITANYIRFRQKEPDYFVAGSLRTIRLTSGVKAVIGCPRAGAREEDHVHTMPEGTTGPAIQLSAAEGGEKCGKCAPVLTVARGASYQECLAKAAELGELKTSKDVYGVLKPVVDKEDQELFLVVPLDVRYQLRGGVVEIHRGSRARVEVSTVDVMRAVLVSGASYFVVAHCHPSGKAKPSDADKKLTKALAAAAKPFGEVQLVDHLVIGRAEFFSIREDKLYKVKA